VDRITCGIDWAEGHHDVAISDSAGTVLARRRIDTGVIGFTELEELFAAHSHEPGTVPVAIETDKNLLVVALQAAGHPVYPINPRAVARYRERYGQAGGKSDPGDARVLADILRTDVHRHRVMPRMRQTPWRSRRWRASTRKLSGPSTRQSAGCGRCCWSSIPKRSKRSRT